MFKRLYTKLRTEEEEDTREEDDDEKSNGIYCNKRAVGFDQGTVAEKTETRKISEGTKNSELTKS